MSGQDGMGEESHSPKEIILKIVYTSVDERCEIQFISAFAKF